MQRFSDERRGTRHERGYGSDWDKRRERVLRRDKGLCQPCASHGRVTLGNEVDHRVNKAEARRLGWTEGQIEADDNLQTICRGCHRAKTADEARRARAPSAAARPPGGGRRPGRGGRPR